MRYRSFSSVVLLLLSLFVKAPSAEAQFEGMLSRVPLDANTLVLIDADKLFGSPLADRERWEAKRQAAFEAGVSALPPDASAVVLAAHSDLELGRNSWEVAITRFTQGRAIQAVASRFGGSIDRIAERDVALLPGDHYVVQISPQLLGSYIPANRQAVSRWLASTDKTNLNATMSSYLTKAYGYAAKVGTPIVMALDLEGMISPQAAKYRLASFDAFKADNDSIEKLASLAGSLQGVTLGITVSERLNGAIRVDFAQAPTVSPTILKAVLLESLARHGAAIEDFESWQPSVDSQTFLLKGALSSAGARKVLSVLELPPSLATALDEAGSRNASGAVGATPSKLYFQSVTKLLDDLRVKPKRDGVQTTGQAALWFDKYARKIDQLPILNVDPVLLSYGADMANGLRDANAALKGVGMRTAVRTMNLGTESSGPVATYGSAYVGGYGYGFGGTGYSYFNLRSGDRVYDSQNAAIRTQERVSGVSTVQTIWRNIDEATAMVRKEMTQKYETEF